MVETSVFSHFIDKERRAQYGSVTELSDWVRFQHSYILEAGDSMLLINTLYWWAQIYYLLSRTENP